MEDIPGYVAGTFIAIVIAVLGFIFFGVSAASNGKRNLTPSFVITFLVAWIFVVSVLVFDGYFTNLSGTPRIPLVAGFTFLLIILAFAIPRSKALINNIPITTLHYIHIVRIPLQMVIWWLAVSKAMPMDVTFEGSNLDILSGISAPFAAVFMVGARSKSKLGAIIWNVIALGLLINFIQMAISYTPYFYTPSLSKASNLAVFYFPYILMPTFIMPVLICSHLVALNQLIFKKDQSQF